MLLFSMSLIYEQNFLLQQRRFFQMEKRKGDLKSHGNDEHNQAMKLLDDRNNRDKSSTIIHQIANKP